MRRVPHVVAVLALAVAYSGDGVRDRRAASPVYWRVLPAVRGRILDASGVALADQRRAFNIYVVPDLFDGSQRARLIGLLELDDREVAELDRRVDAAEPAHAVLALVDQGRERADLVEAAAADLGGAVLVRDDSHRVHRHGETGAHLVGTVGGDSPVGRSGIEQSMERWLHGTEGSERMNGPVEAPVAGNDVVLTIDIGLQRAAEEAIGGYPAAAAVAVEVETGRILALASVPSFDPDAAPATLPVDRTMGQTYRPASTFKLVTALAGLESGELDLDDTVTCTGERVIGSRVLRDMGAHGTVDFLAALQKSCNVYFWSLAERVGMNRLRAVARDLGYGEATGIGLGGELPGGLGAATDDLVHTLLSAVGSADVRVTPVQVAMAYAALANGGRLYAPQLVRRVQTSLGQVLEERTPVLRRTLAVSPASLALVREGMRRAVNQPGGTGYGARKGLVVMAGKTGTTDLTRPATFPHAWFAGWAPADRPEIAVVALVENGGVGGVVAAPIARAIVDAYFARGARHGRR